MKLIEKYEAGKPVYVTVTWGQHIVGCSRCGNVDIDKTSTWVNACAQGSALLAEKAREIHRPVQKKKAAEVLEWAKKAGVFKI